MTAVKSTVAVASLSETARRFLAAPRFAVVATQNKDGSPLQAVVWYKVEGDTVLFNSRLGRLWPANLQRDRRVSIAVADGYDYVEMRGDVEIDEDPVRGQAVIADLARRYHKDEAAAAAQIEGFAKQRRVTFALRPTRVFERFSGP
ncbi:MAG TPA: TIGR03618 family F420-dependent PPOX class oxidoreductase [Candidatus Limnocylindrales bacterium]|jgi:PPOX class probable F420-dependent enzyme